MSLDQRAIEKEMREMEAVEALRKALSTKKLFDEGTVVRWKVASPYTGRIYTYAAIFAANSWYLTGGERYYGAERFNTDRFVQTVLGTSGVSAIEIATAWETV